MAKTRSKDEKQKKSKRRAKGGTFVGVTENTWKTFTNCPNLPCQPLVLVVGWLTVMLGRKKKQKKASGSRGGEGPSRINWCDNPLCSESPSEDEDEAGPPNTAVHDVGGSRSSPTIPPITTSDPSSTLQPSAVPASASLGQLSPSTAASSSSGVGAVVDMRHRPLPPLPADPQRQPPLLPPTPVQAHETSQQLLPQADESHVPEPWYHGELSREVSCM